MERGNNSVQHIWILILPLRFSSCATLAKAPSLFEPGVLSEKQILGDPKSAGVVLS